MKHCYMNLKTGAKNFGFGSNKMLTLHRLRIVKLSQLSIDVLTL
jgi:hypothetical protein